MNRRAEPRPEPELTRLQHAAIAACRTIYGRGTCACADTNSPDICKNMQSAAFAVMQELAPTELKRLESIGQGRKY